MFHRATVVGYVFFQTVMNRPRIPMDATLPSLDLKRVFFVKQLLCKDIEFKWQLAILLALADARAYIYSRDVALDHVVFLLRSLSLCLA